MLGLKENVILGRLIPAGTGFKSSKNPIVSKLDNSENDSEIIEKEIVEEETNNANN